MESMMVMLPRALMFLFLAFPMGIPLPVYGSCERFSQLFCFDAI